MMKEFSGKLVKIYIEGKDKYKHDLLYKEIVEKFEEDEISGVTVVKGIEGFGEGQKIHENFIEVLAGSLPVVIEVVIKNEKIDELIKIVESMIETGKVAIMEEVKIYSFSE